VAAAAVTLIVSLPVIEAFMWSVAVSVWLPAVRGWRHPGAAAQGAVGWQSGNAISAGEMHRSGVARGRVVGQSSTLAEEEALLPANGRSVDRKVRGRRRVDKTSGLSVIEAFTVSVTVSVWLPAMVGVRNERGRPCRRGEGVVAGAARRRCW
jgi:hypothetical protein